MKFGFVSVPVTGHLNPMTALARKLQSRGNEVVFIGLPDAEPIVRAANDGLRQDEGVDGNEPQEVSRTARAGTRLSGRVF